MAMLYSRNPTGTVGLGLFVLALSPFALSIFLPHFDMFLPHFGGSVAAGALLAVVLARRRPQVPHIDPRSLDEPER